MVIVEMVHDTLTPGDGEITDFSHSIREPRTEARACMAPGADADTDSRIHRGARGCRIEVRVRDPAGLRCRVYAVSAAADFVPAPA